MDAESSYESKQSFVVNIKSVEEIWALLESYGFEVEATLECSDGVFRKTKSKTELTAYNNPPKARIKALRFVGFKSPGSTYARVVVGGTNSVNVSFSVNGSVTQVSEMREALVHTFDSIKPWYDVATKVDFLPLVALALIFFGFYTMFMSHEKGAAQITSTEALIMAILTSLMIVLSFALIWALNKLKRLVFPKAVLLIGNGLQRDDVAEKVRWGVVVTFIVGMGCAFAFKPFA